MLCIIGAIGQTGHKQRGYEAATETNKANTNTECYTVNGRHLSAGDKVYAVYNEKAVVMWHIGTESPEKGMNLLGTHIDSPRIDVKPNPLYESNGFAYLDTHYYGGIKKYQWQTIPLSLHGVVIKKDGSKVDICIGEKDEDPVFAISDLLIHLSRAQLEKPAAKVIEGESLDLLIGSIPQNPVEEDANKEPIKHAILDLLKAQYGIDEEDFLSAELEIVPVGKARDLGFDRIMRSTNTLVTSIQPEV